jgi:hypothetical protein
MGHGITAAAANADDLDFCTFVLNFYHIPSHDVVSFKQLKNSMDWAIEGMKTG